MEQDLLKMGAIALRKAALNEKAKEYILSDSGLYTTIKKAAERYIGGETLEETIIKVKDQNTNGFKCSIEFMGENTLTEIESNEATDEFNRILQAIKIQNLNSTVSLDLSHIGLAVSKELCMSNLDFILKEAKSQNTEVIISAEGVERTDDIIDAYKQVSKTYDNVSITLQAYLYRTQDDFKDLIQENGRIRMVKGAFETPKHLSMPRGKDLDDVYLNYVDQLLAADHKCSIATHDHKIQQEAIKLIKKYQSSTDVYEFESLYGIQTEQLAELKKQGYATKLYFVYGKEWYLYLCNRIAEYPMYLFRALNDIVA